MVLQNQISLSVVQGYNVSLIFFLRLWPIFEPKISYGTDIYEKHAIFFEVFCFEAESYEEWQEAIYISNYDKNDTLTSEDVFQCAYQFCQIYNKRYKGELQEIVNVLGSMKQHPEKYQKEWQIWNDALSDVVSERKYVCSQFFWDFNVGLGHFSEDTPEARELIEDFLNDPKNKVGSSGSADFRKEIYLKKLPGKRQLWGYTYVGSKHPDRSGIALDAGIHIHPQDVFVEWVTDSNHENGGLFVPYIYKDRYPEEFNEGEE